jgi:hypothetical protein
MPTIITDSPNISSLDSKIIADLCVGNFIVDVSPSVFISGGGTNVLGVKVKIANPQGVAVRDYPSSSYDIPAASPMVGNYTFSVPTQAGNFQYGKYIISVQLTDADSTIYEYSKSVRICAPNPLDKTKKYGKLAASLIGRCKDAILSVILDSAPAYQGHVADSQTQSLTVYFPSASGVEPKERTLSSFSENLFEGFYKVTGDVCVTYNLGDNFYAKVPYKVNESKEIFCSIDEETIAQVLAGKYEAMGGSCSGEEKQALMEICNEVLLLLELARATESQGISPSDYISKIEDLLGINLDPINQGTPVTPSVSLVDLETLQNAVRVHPVYVPPTVTLSSTQSTSGLEVGQIITIPLSILFSQNDGGNAIAVSLKRNGIKISEDSFTDSNVVMTTTPKVYQASISYGDGIVKENNLQELDSLGRIPSGTVISNSLNYMGYYKFFFGAVVATPSNSLQVRGLSSQTENNLSIILNTGTTLMRFAFWIPSSYSLLNVTDLDVNADITSEYIQSSLSVNDAGGNPVSGKLYVMSQSVPYSSNHRHSILIA